MRVFASVCICVYMHEWTCMYVCVHNSVCVCVCVCVQQLDTYDHEISMMMQLKLMYDIIFQDINRRQYTYNRRKST